MPTEKKFDWMALPGEIKWEILDYLTPNRTMNPYFYKRNHARSIWPTRQYAQDVGKIPLMLYQVELTLPGEIFWKLAEECDMIEKTAIRGNLFFFDKPENLARWLRETKPYHLSQVRKMHLSFTHGDFIRFFNSDLQPGRKGHGSFVAAARTLGQLALKCLYLEPQASDDMKIHTYFRQPQPFGCHAKAVGYIVGLFTRRLLRTKRIVLCGLYYRPHWQGVLNDSFHAANVARETIIRAKEKGNKVDVFEQLHSDSPGYDALSDGRKLHQIREREETPQAHGGTLVPRRHSLLNGAIAHASQYQFKEGTDLPHRREEDEDEVLWPCECRVTCTEDYFDIRDPPPSPPPPQQKESEEEECTSQAEVPDQQHEKSSAGGHQEPQADSVASQDTCNDEDEEAENWMPECTELNGADFWLV
ncbi:hypothetical protein B0J12DRAFT_786260 [Macrophomina phaseolina]|uniref:Uncharacterized protein n=1 Tax=Macrophomina phaseolina TaxID=35725 RepID=A0ABQ8G8S3_9PEZI|nr:hypothetical protein B0J12DRAFT_786260 [Macrophomina phaseolina]